MGENSKLKMGETYYPSKKRNEISENYIRGPGWKVELVSGQYVFEFLASRHGGGVDCYALTEDEFNQVKSDNLSFEDLLNLTDRNPNRDLLSK